MRASALSQLGRFLMLNGGVAGLVRNDDAIGHGVVRRRTLFSRKVALN